MIGGGPKRPTVSEGTPQTVQKKRLIIIMIKSIHFQRKTNVRVDHDPKLRRGRQRIQDIQLNEIMSHTTFPPLKLE